MDVRVVINEREILPLSLCEPRNGPGIGFRQRLDLHFKGVFPKLIRDPNAENIHLTVQNGTHRSLVGAVEILQQFPGVRAATRKICERNRCIAYSSVYPFAPVAGFYFEGVRAYRQRVPAEILKQREGPPHTLKPSTLKRDVVVGDSLPAVIFLLLCRRRRRTLRASRHRYRRLRVLLATLRTAAPGTVATHQNQFVRHNLGHVLLLAVFVFPAARLQPSFDIDLLTLKKIVGNVFGSPENNVVPVRLFLPFPRLLIFPAPVGRQTERRAGGAPGGELGFRILAEAAEQDDFVDGARCHITLNFNTASEKR